MNKVEKRETVTFGSTRKVLTGCGNLYVTINNDKDGKPLEVFAQLGKAGGCSSAQTEAIGRLASLNLRAGVSVDEIISQTRGISCHLPVGFGENKVTSCSDAVSKALSGHTKKAVIKKTHQQGACPDCGGTIEHSDGCIICRSCGYSEC